MAGFNPETEQVMSQGQVREVMAGLLLDLVYLGFAERRRGADSTRRGVDAGE